LVGHSFDEVAHFANGPLHDALAKPETLTDIRVGVAAGWIRHAGEKMYRDLIRREGRELDAQPGSARWNLWKARFREVSIGPDDEAGRAVVEMSNIDGSSGAGADV